MACVAAEARNKFNKKLFLAASFLQQKQLRVHFCHQMIFLNPAPPSHPILLLSRWQFSRRRETLQLQHGGSQTKPSHVSSLSLSLSLSVCVCNGNLS